MRLSETEEYCEELYRSTTYRNSDGRYVVTLHFRQEFLNYVTLGDSRHVYQKILTSDVRKHPNGNLIAQTTVFGRIVTDEVFQSEPPFTIPSFCNQVELNAQLARFLELEEICRKLLNEVPLGDSRHSALSQFRQNETRLLKNPDL
ncbi:hypothetical protein CVS40_11231 [Lucilia cuprina]|nr:hypothetical protein CVS40_11231 [Lucilia cuprina]